MALSSNKSTQLANIDKLSLCSVCGTPINTAAATSELAMTAMAVQLLQLLSD